MITAALPPPTRKGLEARKDKRSPTDIANQFATAGRDPTKPLGVEGAFPTGTIATRLKPVPAESYVDSTEFDNFPAPRETASIDSIQAQSDGANIPSAAAMKAAYLEQTRPKAPAGEEIDLDSAVVAEAPLTSRKEPFAGGGMAELLAQIQAGRDDAKAMGLLTAGLGIMQQASQPGATLLSSIPGAAAGVKQYSSDKANLAKQQMALATLANQQEATRIAAQRATKPNEYERYERDVLADYKNSPDWEKYFFDDGTGNPGRVKPTVRSEIRKTYTRTLDPSLTGSRLMQTYVKYEESKAGQARLGQIRKDLKAKGVDDATAFREAPLILRREFLSGGSAPLVKAPTNRPDIATFNKAG